MKVCVIGLDGLEPSLVSGEHFNLGFSGVVNNSGIPLQTPVLWASFLTGSTEHGVKGMRRQNRFSSLICKIVGFQNANKIISMIGVDWAKLYTKADLGMPTIFDLADNSVAISVPAYNEPKIYLDIRRNTVLTFDGKYPKELLVKEVWQLFHEEVNQSLEALEKGCDLLMVHLFATDTLGHLCWNNPKRLIEWYKKVEKEIEPLIRKANDYFTIIAGDHGMERGLHTRKGYWSSNYDVDKENIHITDFFNIVKEALYF